MPSSLNGYLLLISREGRISPDLYNNFSGQKEIELKNNDPSCFLATGGNRKDLSFYEDEEYFLIIHGEVFLKRAYLMGLGTDHLNDNHLLLGFYRQHARACVKFFKGTFNAIFIKKSDNTIWGFNDFLGIKPLYYSQTEDYWVCSNSLENLEVIPNFPKAIDRIALAEYLLFNFPLGPRSFFENVSRLEPGATFEIIDQKLSEYAYTFSTEFLPDSSEMLSTSSSLEALERTFKEVVAQFTRTNSSFALSLTGGFDGRTILSVVPQGKRFTTYTFGAPGADDLSFAADTAKKLGIFHRPFLIDDAYYKSTFDESAMEFIHKTDALGTFERAHYLDTFKKLSPDHSFAFSGNAGSEVFRTIRNGGILVSQLFFDLLMAKDKKTAFRNYYRNSEAFHLLSKDIHQSEEALIASWEKSIGAYLEATESYRDVYRFILREVIRKWFGTEMEAEAAYLPNRSPYIDYDFLMELKQTPFCAANQNLFENNPASRKKGQLLYAYIINKNSKKLSEIPTSKGYAPKHIYNPFLNIFLLKPYLNKGKKRDASAQEFNSTKTLQTFVGNHLETLKGVGHHIDINALKAFYHSGHALKSKRVFSKALSWQLWFEQRNS